MIAAVMKRTFGNLRFPIKAQAKGVASIINGLEGLNTEKRLRARTP